jgi:ketosteroid isomerase-like protein
MTDEQQIREQIERWVSAVQDHALLRCGKPEDFAKSPEMRLRLTIGLRKVDGAWMVEHEHHSYPAE